jgi:diguanylate cyclase
VDLVLAPFARLLPIAGDVGARRRRAAAAATAILLLSLAAHVIYAVIGEGASPLADVLVNQVARQLTMISAALLCALSVRRGDPDGGAWLALAIGLGLWVVGNSYWSLFLAEAENPPIPSPADAGRLAFYPFACLCLGLHARRAVRGIPGSMWLDGLVGVLAVAAIGIAFMVGPILATTRGSTVELVVDAAYPIGDILLLALVAAFLGLAGRLAETRRQASTDELTGLPNRRWFDRELRRAIDHARAADEALALLVIDLDHFKELNDTLGHHAGDRVLAQLGPRILSALREGDRVARLGGDEFAVLLRGAGAAEGAGERIAAALSERSTVEDIELQIAASIGVALFPVHGDDAETLLQRADVAMYQAKRRRSGTEFYARERDMHTRERLQLIGELRDAVARDHLTLHFQPKLDLGRNRINGVEALVRWPHPTRGMVPPDEFIPLAEQTGVIGPLTELVIRKALRQAADWAARGIALTMAVNVSATNLLEDGWTEGVLAAQERHGVRPDRFVVEITEDVLMTDPDRSLTALAVLSAAGVRVALDDFGTGYSSLSYLKRLPVDELKIDRSFVFEMGTDPADAAIVQTAVDSAAGSTSASPPGSRTPARCGG